MWQRGIAGGGSGGAADTTFIYANPNSPSGYIEYNVQHDADNKFYIIINMFNGANGTYLNNMHIYTKTSGGSYVEQTAWKGLTPLYVGKSSTGTYSTGFNAWIYEIKTGETGFFDVKQGMTIKLQVSTSTSGGVGMIY